MAEVDNLFNVKGKIKNTVFYNLNGKKCVKSCPSGIRDPKTPGQLRERSRFRVAVRFYQRLKLTFAREILRLSAKGRASSGYALYMRLNLNLFKPDGEIGDFSRLRFSVGERRGVFNLTGEEDDEGVVTLRWEIGETGAFAGQADRLIVILIHARRSFSPVMVEGLEAVRTDGKASFRLAEGDGLPVHAYCCFAARDLSGFSDTQHVRVGRE